MRVLFIHSDMLNSRNIYRGPLAQLHRYMHHHNIAERNVVMAANGTLMLIDLGLAVPQDACEEEPCPDEELLSDHGAFE
jgi:tRNA A-37 threonylcarbamoyl transferase component Bud32